MKPEKQHLLDELFGSENRGETALAAGTRILRRRRHWRSTGRGFGWALLLVLAAFWLEYRDSRHPPAQASAPRLQAPRPVQMKSLTDDELLALFPNTPVGLATLPNGRKLLLFPRPGDEAKYVGRF